MSAPKLDFGAPVRTLPHIPIDYRPRERGWVCGVREVATESEAVAAGVRIGTVLYIIEFDDGSSMEIPEEYLAAIEE